MEYLVGSKKIRLNPGNMKFSKSLGSGSTADVYLIEGKAYKIYRPYRGCELLTKDKIDLFKTIPTKRIIMPEEVLLDKRRNICGTISMVKEDLGLTHYFDFSKEKLLYELELLYDDGILLGDSGIQINDFFLENISFHEGIYMIDVGKFKTMGETSYDENQTISYNINSIHEGVINQFLANRNFCSLNDYPQLRSLRLEYIQSLDKGILNHLNHDMQNETVGQYIKRKLR